MKVWCLKLHLQLRMMHLHYRFEHTSRSWELKASPQLEWQQRKVENAAGTKQKEIIKTEIEGVYRS